MAPYFLKFCGSFGLPKYKHKEAYQYVPRSSKYHERFGLPEYRYRETL